MKILRTEEFKAHLVVTDEPDNNEYTRYSADNWTVRMGEGDEMYYDCGELEKAFQDSVSS